MDKIVSSNILDDAREKIKLEFRPFHPSCMMCGLEGECFANDEKLGNKKGEYRRNPLLCVASQKDADQILAISGTTDIECPECMKGFIIEPDGVTGDPDFASKTPCPKCDNGVIKHKWKVSVTLENGELPDLAHRALDWILATKDNEPCQIADELESFLKELDDGKRG